MPFRLGVLPVVAALMLCLPNLAGACSFAAGIAPQEHSAPIDAGPQTADSGTEQTTAALNAGAAETPSIVSRLQRDDLDAFHSSRFVSPNDDEIAALIASSFSLRADADVTGSIAPPSAGPEWAMDGLEDR
jgi:hypothetical protein